MKKIASRLVVLLASVATYAPAQQASTPLEKMAADAHPSFDVATVKLHDPNDPGRSIGKRGRSFYTRNTSLSELIEYAYDIHGKQVVGAPNWAEEEKFDLSAIPDQPGVPSDRQWKVMLQQLLAERFQLIFHHDKKELSVYVLSVTKSGPRNLTKSDSTASDFNLSINPTPGGIGLTLQHGSITNFAVFGLQGAVLDRPVLDQTGLTGRFDLFLKWTPDESQFGGRVRLPDVDNPAPGLFTAIQEQLGLKLESVKAPADVLVIDHAEKPSAN